MRDSVKIERPVPLERRTKLPLPMYSGCVEAGFPSPADDHMERMLDLNEEIVRNPAATFFVRVQGHSMKDAGIHPGDILVVDRSLTPTDRQIVVAMIDGEFTVKRFRKNRGKVFLEAENPDFKSIEIREDQDMTLWGVVSYIIHKASS